MQKHMTVPDWSEIRQRYQLVNQRTYFNTPSFCAMSDRTVAVQVDCLELFQTKGNQLNEQAQQAAEEIRQIVLELTHTDDHEVAIIPDVSTAMNHLAELLHDCKKVALLREDYPAASSPWIVRDFDITWVERRDMAYDLKEIEDVLKSGVQVLALSWVMYNSGAILDLQAIGELCKQYDVIFIVDGTQGLVAQDLDLSKAHIDVMLVTAFKWMLAGYGIGVAIARKGFVAKHPIRVAGQNTIVNGEKSAEDLTNYRSGIERFELGHAKIQQVLALACALNELKSIGFEMIQQRTAELMGVLRSSLQEGGIDILTPAVASANMLVIEGTAERADQLKQAGIDFTYRHGLIRLGIYFYNNETDISRLIQALN
ncbi:aminotransferase class V-fold PLP-dependent enzyme [Reichenbachiella carrageenanivorans]|uniref:Aminotransferase class V-fold PLP-dependent enzyme n=1 Tax=Reichenbachiella carrageenanivorans TaxID=2979869 RepID=A0ABY6CZW7_9BACT|nr:aminotransferase class V-fold PLP-dependent enzyme [Reichenbachiella carrageenanivorans]UXX78348.1 aminotransferase class V-fold PLP-dependent enzyme [Reichenbachiella carrageenanivorans]